MSRIFINYRRGDSKWATKALGNCLTDNFGEDRVFMDIDTIKPGQDFVKAIEDAVGSCDALVVMIGKNWLHMTDDRGTRRLDNTNDYVRLEIASALKRDITVIPILIDGAEMPHAEDLPNDIAALARRNALEISEKRFDYDSGRLIDTLKEVVGLPSPPATVLPTLQEPMDLRNTWAKFRQRERWPVWRALVVVAAPVIPIVIGIINFWFVEEFIFGAIAASVIAVLLTEFIIAIINR